MTRLGERIARMIAAAGPMSLAEYMAVCLADPRDGYYSRREAIGRQGDFITAPQVSQALGEIVAVWCVAAWRAMGSPARVVLAEAGPGNATMMADLLRAAASFPGFAAALEIVLIETGAAMIERQRDALAGFGVPVSWIAGQAELPAGPLILLANEFLDALPVRQYVKSRGAWRERCVGLGDDGRLRWQLGPGTIDAALLPAGSEAEPDGAVFEIAPAREAWVETLAGRLKAAGGMALLVDYGHARSGFGDTFQAVRAHRHADPLATPGEADLTAHVDFAALRRIAGNAGVTASPVVMQGDFLLAMGIAERAGRLGADAGEATRERLRGEVERLVQPDQMGNLFKVLALSAVAPGAPPPDLPPFVTPARES